MSGTAPSPPPGQGGSVLPEGRRGMLLSDEPCFSEPSQSSFLRYRAARRLPTTSEVSPVSARPYISALSLPPAPQKNPANNRIPPRAGKNEGFRPEPVHPFSPGPVPAAYRHRCFLPRRIPRETAPRGRQKRAKPHE